MVKINNPTEKQQMRYLNDLYKAFKKVDKSYCSSNYLYIHHHPTKREKQYAERVFAYELYHQFRKIMESKPNAYTDLVLNGEIPKMGFRETDIAQQRIDPDLVLHKGQDDCSPEYQKLFIEIKTSLTPNLQKDITKLKVAVGDRLNYQYAVLISINSDLAYVKEAIKTCNRQLVSSIDKLYLIHPDLLEPTPFHTIIN